MDVIQVPRLEPKDLYERRVRRDHARLRAYNTLLEQIYHRIYASSQLPGNVTSILYSVPPFILGLPKLDMEDCVVYLVWQLREAKFQVQFTWPNLLSISWKHHEGDYLKHQNPIIQAMTPEPVAQGANKKDTKQTPAPKKKKEQVSYAREIEVITSSPSEIKDITVSPSSMKKRAAEYEPPSSFLQQMERPVKEKSSTASVLSDLWAIR